MNFPKLRHLPNLLATATALFCSQFNAVCDPSVFYFGTNAFYLYEGQTLDAILYRAVNTVPNGNYGFAVLTNVSNPDKPIRQPQDLNLVWTNFPNFSGQQIYNWTKWPIYIPSGPTSIAFSISSNDNSTNEPDRVALMSTTNIWFLNTAINGSYQQTAYIFLLDNDAPFTVAADYASFLEGDTNYFVLNRSTNNTKGPMVIRFTLEGAGTLGTDYQISSPFPLVTGTTNQLTFPPGQSEVVVQVTALRDYVLEGSETVTLRVQPNPVQYPTPNPATTTMTIVDDTPVVGVYAIPSIVSEGQTTTLYFENTNAHTVTPAFTVNYAIGGTASNGTDYTYLNGVATIPRGVYGTNVTVSITTDTNVEGAETLSATVTSGQYALLAGGTNTVITLMDDYPVITVEATDAYAVEGTNDTGVFTVMRSGNLSQAVTVQFTVTGTAANGVDYTALSTNVTLGAGVGSSHLTVIALVDALTEPAETVVLSLKTNSAYVLGLHTNAVVTIAGEGPNPRDTFPRGERYVRGTGTNWTNYSLVIPVDGLKGTRRSDWETNGAAALFHYNGTNTASQSQTNNRLIFNTPIASFGGTNGSSLFAGQSYDIYFFAGDPHPNFAPVQIAAYYRFDGTLAGTVQLAVPNTTSSNDWSSFTSSGFSRSTNAYGLNTVLRSATDLYYMVGGWGTYLLSHTAGSDATNYTYRIEAKGNVGTNAMVIDGTADAAYEPLYTLEFSPRPATRSRFIDQPHFAGQPLPPDLWNKTPEELMSYGAAVTNVISLDTNACKTLDNSPELRRHPILDQFVADLNNDPLALANYVFNEIGLTDAIAIRDDGSVTNESVNLGGVNRGALGVYLEGQGSPIEQCSLLIYLLRQAGYPATYVFPPDGGLKLLDTRLSQLLRLRVNGAQDEQGRFYTTNRLISVNYPWVAAYVGGRWVHLFPWLKDTEVIEGFDLYDFLPDAYREGQLWAKDYVLAKTNLTSLAALDDDTPARIYPQWLTKVLETNAPGISVDDLGMRYVNRRHLYARWEDFPRPTWTTNTSTAVESLTASGITNVSPRLTNLFDTITIELASTANPQTKMQTAEMRIADLHNRRFYLTHTNITGGHQAVLSLASFQPGGTSTGSFSAGDATLTNRQEARLTLTNSDDVLTLRFRYRRQKALAWEQALDPDRTFLDVSGAREVLDERTIRKGDLAAICLNVGRVTPAMLRVHAEDLWNLEQKLSTNAGAASQTSVDLYEGTLTYLMGMGYYERQGRFNEWNLRLHKVMNLSQFAVGLAKIGPRRDSYGNLATNVVDPIWPNVDMYYVETVNVANGTARPDSGRDGETAVRNYLALSAADGSAQEHQILNTFFGRSNAVSTVKLLQLAQLSATNGRPGVVELNYFNYQQMGESTNTYDGRKLKEQNSAMWAAVAAYFQQGSYGLYSVGWMTPGIVSAPGNYFADVAVLILSPGGTLAGIGANQRGGFADRLLDNTISTTTVQQWETRVDTEGDYHQSFTDPTTGQKQAAAEATTLFDMTSDQSQLNSGAAVVNPEQVLQGQVNGYLINNASGTYQNTYDDALDLGPQGGASFWERTLATVADPVDTMTGEFHVDELDLNLPGPIPLQVRRNYGSLNLNANQLGYGWKLNYMPFLTVGVTNPVIYASEPDGSVIVYESITNNLWAPTPAKNPTLNNQTVSGIGSVANHFNARLAKAGSTYYLTNGDGSLRVFVEMNFPLTNSAAWDRQRPYLTTWYDNRGNYYRFEYGTNSTQTDYGQVRRIVSSSGNIVRFLYDPYARIVEAYSLDGRRLQYDYSVHGDLVTVTLPDASERHFDYLLKTFNVTNGSAITTNTYSTHLLVHELKPDGRVLQNEYDDQRRVTNQWATVGPDLRLVRNATFRYTNSFNLTNLSATNLSGTTTVLDYTNNATTYFYTNGLIRRVRDPLGGELVQDWYEPGDASVGAYQRSLKSVTDQRGLVTTFLYDSRGNATNITRRGDLLGDGNTNTTAVSLASYDPASNLPTRTVDESGRTNLFFYTNTWLLARLESWPSNATAAQAITNLYSYTMVTNAANGTVAYGLRQREIRAGNSPDAATTDWTHDSRGFVTLETRYTGTTDPNVTVTNLFNNRGELAERTDAAGRTLRFGFDPRGSLQSREVFEAGQSIPASWEFSYYNDNGEPTWSDGPRFNPEDYVWRDYDGAGRKTQEIHWRSRVRRDGSGVEAETGDNLYATTFLEYDPFNNLTKVTDPRGNYSLKQYDAEGRLLREEFYDATGALLATNGLRYNLAGDVTTNFNALGAQTEWQYTSTGQPKFQRNPDGSTNAWRYLADGRLQKEVQGNGAYWLTTYDDANRKTTRIFHSAAGTPLATNTTELDRRGNIVKTTDAAGNVFTNLFDGLDRIKVAAGPAITNSPANPPPGPSPAGLPSVTQQITTYTYDASSKVLTVANALGDKTITTSDALGRPVSVEVRDTNNALARITTTAYSADHHGVTVTNGSGSGAIVTTTFTDSLGNQLLSIGYPSANVREFTLKDYDPAGNHTFEGRYSSTNGAVSVWRTNAWTYDGLNRVRTETVRDGATMTYVRDALGNVTLQLMPGSLLWRATYNTAGQITKDWDQVGAAGARTNTYAYYPSDDRWAGLLKTITDGRGVTRTNSYDEWLRVASVRTDGALNEQKMTVDWQYDVRGFATNLTQSFASTNAGPASSVRRGYNAYGQLVGETVTLNGGILSSLSQGWDSAGRRSSSAGVTFRYRADGLMTAAGGASFGYADNGLLTGRTNAFRSWTVSQRDGVGRPLQATTRVGGQTPLTETWSWTGDGLPSSYVGARSDFTDTRNFSYASLSRRLVQESLNLGSGQSVTNSYTFDNGTAAGLGVLTKVAQASLPAWSAKLDAFARVSFGTNSVIHRTARGTVNGPATVRGTLNNLPVDVRYDRSSAGPWSADLALVPGTNTLTVYADHISGQFTTNKSSTFTVSAGALDKEESQYDGAGNVTNLVWRNASGQVVKSQALTWDAFGRLMKIAERDTNNHGFNLTSVFDGLGRQIQTVETTVSNNVALTLNPQPSTINFTYDPQVEFQVVGLSLSQGANTRQDWLAYGPDISGRYGGMHGVGGLETISTSGGVTVGIINDAFGNVLGAVTNLTVGWNAARANLYAPVEGYTPPRLSLSAPTHASFAWRTRAVNTAGFVQLGERPYDYTRHAFLSADPYGHASDPALHTAFNQNPAFYFDADGRLSRDYFLNKGAESIGLGHGLGDFGTEIIGLSEMSSPLNVLNNLVSGNGLTPQADAARNWLQERFDPVVSLMNPEQGTHYAAGWFVGDVAPNLIPIGGLEKGGATVVGGLMESAVQRMPWLGTDLGQLATRTLGRMGTWFERFGAEGEGAFANYMRQAQTLDVSTAPNSAVFYSGPGNRALAEEFAVANGRTTLEMTPGGAWLDQQQLFNTAQSGLTTEQAAQVWSTLSQRFAVGASGNAVGFVNGARAGSIFNTVEYPALLNNRNIVNVITGGH